MRLLLFVFVGLVLTFSGVESGEKKQPPKTDLKGSWKITWLANNSVNPIVLSKSDDVIEGTYVNDAKETCKVTGRFDRAKGTVNFTITSPQWEIMCEGSLANPKLIEGNYLAYGNSTGIFRMARDQQ